MTCPTRALVSPIREWNSHSSIFSSASFRALQNNRRSAGERDNAVSVVFKTDLMHFCLKSLNNPYLDLA